VIPTLFFAGMGALRTALTARTGPVLVLAFAIVWPLAGFPWWPLIITFGMVIALRVIGFGNVITGNRGPVVILVMLLGITLFQISVWHASLGLGLCLAAVGTTRLPKWQLLAAAGVLTLGSMIGVVVDSYHAKDREAAERAAEDALIIARSLPHGAQDVMVAWMGAIRDGYTDRDYCYFFTEDAKRQVAQAYNAPDCLAAVQLLHRQVTNVDGYLGYNVRQGLKYSSYLTDLDRVVAEGCNLIWGHPLFGDYPKQGPDPGRLVAVQELGVGHRVTEYHRC